MRIKANALFYMILRMNLSAIKVKLKIKVSKQHLLRLVVGSKCVYSNACMNFSQYDSTKLNQVLLPDLGYHTFYMIAQDVPEFPVPLARTVSSSSLADFSKFFMKPSRSGIVSKPRS